MSGYGFENSPGHWDRQTWSLTVGSIWGIRVRLHALFLFFAAFELLQAFGQGLLETQLVIVVSLFLIVLLHEFGHCFACRLVGGNADDILIWPLGGLAFVQPPHRPFESMVTTLGGPLVNVLIAVLIAPILYLFGAFPLDMLNPFSFELADVGSRAIQYLAIAWKLNYIVLLFNMLPIFPMDFGRLLQELIWMRSNYHHSMIIATQLGIIGGILLAAVSLYAHHFLMLFVAGWGFVECLRMRKDLELMGQMPESEFGYDFSAGYTSLERTSPSTRRPQTAAPSLRGHFKSWLERRRQKQRERLESELDRILIKIHEHGSDSLTRYEKRVLADASQRRRKS